MITAFRDDPDDDEECVMDLQPVEGNSPNQKNMVRNRDLEATLTSFRYGVTEVQGTYIENYKEEECYRSKGAKFFCRTTTKDDPKFFANLEMLAQKFCQDSVLLIPQGGEGAYLKGTNNAWPGLGSVSRSDHLQQAKKQSL